MFEVKVDLSTFLTDLSGGTSRLQEASRASYPEDVVEWILQAISSLKVYVQVTSLCKYMIFVRLFISTQTIVSVNPYAAG
jgi:hypothetical protein